MNTDDSADKPAGSGITRSSAPEGAAAEIVSPANGATVSSPVKVVFGLEGMDVSPAGKEKENSGHHHLLIDLDKMPDMNMPCRPTTRSSTSVKARRKPNWNWNRAPTPCNCC